MNNDNVIEVKYSNVISKLQGNADEILKKIDNMGTSLNQDDYDSLAKLFLGDNIDGSRVEPGQFSIILDMLYDDIESDYLEKGDILKAIIDKVRNKFSITFSDENDALGFFISGNCYSLNYNGRGNDTVQIIPRNNEKLSAVEAHDSDGVESSDNVESSIDDGSSDSDENKLENFNGDVSDELGASIDVDYQEEVEEDILIVSYDELRERLSWLINKQEGIEWLKNLKNCEFFEDYLAGFFEFLLGKKLSVKDVDIKDFLKFVKSARKDFYNLRLSAESELESFDSNNNVVDNSLNPDNKNNVDEQKKLKDDISFYSNCCDFLDFVRAEVNVYKKDVYDLVNYSPKYKPKYIPSSEKKKFSFKALEPEKFVEAVKKYGKYALAGVGVGLVGAAIVPSSMLAGAGTIRLVYAGTKFCNRIVSKGFLGGEPTPVDKVITSVKEKIKNFEIKKKEQYNPETKKWEGKTVKFSETRLYTGIKKVDAFLKKREVQWFINGMSVGYIVGNWLNLRDKVSKLFNSNEKPITSTTVPNETTKLETGATEPTVPEDTLPVRKPEVQKPVNKPIINDSVNDYSWFDVGKNGDKLDLSGIEEGFVDSYAARGAYTGEYAHLNKSVNLITKYATLDNGTFISELRLADGSVFTGNVGELLKTGVDPSKIAALVSNQNGNYAWMNLEDILGSLAKTSAKVRVR